MSPRNQYADLPVVREHMVRASKYLGDTVARKYLETTDRMISVGMGRSESPLELLFWLWFGALDLANAHGAPGDLIYLSTQEPVQLQGENFRIDFVIHVTEFAWSRAVEAGVMKLPLIAVEVDGHAFHERTPAQVAHRDRRDRLLQQAGWTVFHYSWTEFTKTPEHCIQEVYDFASNAAINLMRQYSLEVPDEYKGQA